MRSVKIGDLKTNLSRYLRLVRNGEEIRVLDRDEPIAVISPTRVPLDRYLARLANQGRVKVGSQDFSQWKRAGPKGGRKVALKDILHDLRVIGGD